MDRFESLDSDFGQRLEAIKEGGAEKMKEIKNDLLLDEAGVKVQEQLVFWMEFG